MIQNYVNKKYYRTADKGIETKIGVRVHIRDDKQILEGQCHWIKGQEYIMEML